MKQNKDLILVRGKKFFAKHKKLSNGRDILALADENENLLTEYKYYIFIPSEEKGVTGIYPKNMQDVEKENIEVGVDYNIDEEF